MDLSITLIFFLSLIGFFTGIVSGLFGIGGGTIIVPMLVYLLGFSHLQAQGTSLAAMVFPVGLFGVIKYYREGYSNFKCSFLLGIGLLVGAWPGAKLAIYLPKAWLKFFYAIFLLYVAWRFIEPHKIFRSDIYPYLTRKKNSKKGLDDEFLSQKPLDPAYKDIEKQNLEKQSIESWHGMLLLGFLGGIASGLFGIGGGAIILPFLILIFRFDSQMARVISLGALLPPVGIFGMLPYIQEGYIQFFVAAPVAIGMLLGAYFGAFIGVNLSKRVVQIIYGFILLGIVINYFYLTIPVIF